MTLILNKIWLFTFFLIKLNSLDIIVDSFLSSDIFGVSYRDLDYLLSEISKNNTNDTFNIAVIDNMKPYVLNNPMNFGNFTNLAIFPKNLQGSFSVLINSSNFAINSFQNFIKIVNARIILNNSNFDRNVYNSSIFQISQGGVLSLEVKLKFFLCVSFFIFNKNISFSLSDLNVYSKRKILFLVESTLNISNFDLQNIKFIENTTSDCLFCLYNSVSNFKNLTISNCFFENFDLIYSETSQVSISSSFFGSINGISDFQPNSILKFSGSLNITSLTFIGNILSDYYLLFSNGDADVSGIFQNSKILNNTLYGSSMMISLKQSNNFDFLFLNSDFRFNFFPTKLIYIYPSNTSSSYIHIYGLNFSFNQGLNLLTILEIDEFNVLNCNFSNNVGTAFTLTDVNSSEFSNVVFFKNKGQNTLPGIYVEGGTFQLYSIIFNSLIFDSNIFYNANDKHSIGVSIIIKNANLTTITNSTFIKNSACFNSSASGDSGIVFVGGYLSVIQSAFVANKVLSSTMALFFTGSWLWIDNCLFKDNSQIDGSFSTLTMPISAIYELFVFSNNICINNFFSQGMITLSSYGSYSFFHSFGSFYKGNYFDRNGQFYLDESANRTILVENCTINDNVGNGYSTILYVYIYSKIILENITFSNSIAINNTCVSSPLLVVWIYSSNVFVNLFQMTYIDMSTYNFGGPLFNIFGLESGFNMTMDGCRLIRSQTKQAGVFWVFQLNLNVSNCIFQDIYAETTASVFYLINSVVVYFTNSTIVNGSSGNNAGAIYANDNSLLVMRNITISDCHSNKDIILIQTFSQLIMRNVSIVNFTNNNLDNIVTVSNTGDLIHEASFLIMKNISNKLFYIQKAGFKFENIEFSTIFNVLFFIKFALNVDISNSTFKDNICNNLDQYCILYGSSSIQITITSTVILNTQNLLTQSLFHIETNSRLIISNLSIKLPPDIINSGLLQALSSDISLQAIQIDQANFYLLNAVNCFSMNLSQISSTFSSNEIQGSQPYIFVSSSLYFSINHSIFKTFNFSEGSFLVWIQNCPSIVIHNNTFSSIFSKGKGAVLKIESSFGVISNSLFLNNVAQRATCILYYTALPFVISDDKTLFILENTFQNNSAFFNGAGVYFEFYPPKFFNNNFINNSGSFAADYSSFPFRLGFRNLHSNQTVSPLIFLTEEHSGKIINEDIEILFYDAYDQVINEDLKTQLNVEISPSLLVQLNKQKEPVFDVVQGLLQQIKDISSYESLFPVSNIEGKTSIFQENDFAYLFTGLLLTSTPKLFNFLYFDTTLLQKMDRDTFLNITRVTLNQTGFQTNEFINSLTGIYNLFLPINVSQCRKGEIYISIKNTCEKCLSGTYSVNANDSSCNPCPDEAICTGGADFALKPGYWRSGLQNTIYLCDKMLDSCLGGTWANCSQGYEGPLCDGCSKNGDGGKRQKKYSGLCEDCFNTGENILVLFAFFIIIILVTLVISNFFIGYKFKTYQKAALRIFINFFHFVTILETYNIALPQYFSQTIYVFSNLARIGDFWFSLACLLDNPGDYSEGVILFTFIIFLVLMIVFYSRFLRKESKVDRNQRIELFIYLLLPSFIDYLYSKIVCIEIDGIYVRTAHKQSVCWDLEYTLWFAVFYLPLILGFGVLIPYVVLRYNNLKISKLLKVGIGLIWQYSKNQMRSQKNTASKFKKNSEEIKKETSINKKVLGAPKHDSLQNNSNQMIPVSSNNSKVKFEQKETPNRTLTQDNGPEINHFLFIGYRTRSLFWECVNHFIKICLILINRSQFQNDIKLVTLLFVFIFVLAFDLSVPSYLLPFLNLLSFISKLMIVGFLYGLLWFLTDDNENQQKEWKEMVFILVTIGYAFYIIGMLWIVFIRDEIKLKIKIFCKKIWVLIFKRNWH